MARCPFANQRILEPENTRARRIVPRTVILHTAVDAPGPTDLARYFDAENIGAESTFYVHLDGTIDQLMDTEREADANGSADQFAISVETEDDSARRGSDILPWTVAQLSALYRLINWCCDVHHIPRRRATSARLPGAAGIAYHSQPMRERFDGTAHNPWTAYQGKSCPGDARVAQYPALVARVAATTNPPKDDDVPYTQWPQKDKDALIEDIRKALLYDITGSKPVDPAKGPWTNLGDVINAIRAK